MASSVCVSSSPVKRTMIIRPKKKIQPVVEPVVEPVEYVVEHEPVFASQNETIVILEPEPYCDMNLFTKQQIKRRLTIPFYRIKHGIDVKQLLTKELSKQLEGHCSIEGYICPNSMSISTYSCGTLNGANIIFDILAVCLICFPDERSIIKCVARTITQAGIRAGAMDLTIGCVSPIEVFLSRDMNMKKNELFTRIEENDILTVEIIGRRFVLHDTHVTVIAMLIDAASP